MKKYLTLTGMIIALLLFYPARAQEYATFTITSPNQGTGTFTNAALPDFTWETVGSLTQDVQILDEETFDDGSQFEADYGQADNEMNLRTQVIPNGAGTAGTVIVSGAITTIVFDEATPADAWGFCLTDIDVENVLIAATDANGDTLPYTAIDSWLVELFDADQSDGVDLPKWDPMYAALLGSDTPPDYIQFDSLVIGGMPSCEAPAAYFKPDIPITKLSITFLNLQEEYNTSYHLFIASQGASAIAETNEANMMLFPNPFATSTTIEYETNSRCSIQCSIYNSVGEVVFEAEDKDVPPGRHTIRPSLQYLPAGMYYAVLRAENGVSVMKMVKQ